MYKIKLERRAEKELAKIHPKERNRIIDTIDSLSQEPHPAGSKKLVNRNAYRIRSGNYRIIYCVENEELLVLVVKIGHRKDVYSNI